MARSSRASARRRALLVGRKSKRFRLPALLQPEFLCKLRLARWPEITPLVLSARRRLPRPRPSAGPARHKSIAELFSRWHKGAAGCSLPFVFLPVHFSGGWHFRHSRPQGGLTNLTNLGFIRLLGLLRLVTPLGYSLHIKDFWIAGLPHTATRSFFAQGATRIVQVLDRRPCALNQNRCFCCGLAQSGETPCVFERFSENWV